MRIVVAPDSFKGSISSVDACGVIRAAITARHPDAVIDEVPLADGGEGTVQAVLSALGGELVDLQVCGPYGSPVTARYLITPDGTAVIETASAAGWEVAGTVRRPDQATTFGVGELIRDAVFRRCSPVMVGLGGSVSIDGGCGAGAALAVSFRDARHEHFVPVGETLAMVAGLDTSDSTALLAGVPVIALCDVDSPLTGPAGAARVFGPQKGATPAMIERLDAGLERLAGLIATQLGVEVARLPGAGAAGGLGAGLVAFAGARLRPGIETILDLVDFDRRLAGADLVITGEGSFDQQSLRGKTVLGVARRAAARGVRVGVLAGRVDPAAAAGAVEAGVSEVLAINPPDDVGSQALRQVERRLGRAGVELVDRLLALP